MIKQHSSFLLFIAGGFLLLSPDSKVNGQAITAENCAVESYYGGLSGDVSTWSREDVTDLIRRTHVNNIRDVAQPLGTNDVWGALIDLDAGTPTSGGGGNAPDDPTVRLVYEGIDVDPFPVAARNWKKERLWPTDRGLGMNGPDYTDVMAIKPVGQVPAVVRGSKYFGDCGVLEKDGVCQVPAEGSASDTCSCNRAYQPPANVRGDIARALMYMDLRYDGSEPNTMNLTLTDCPFNRTTDMGYLSQMLSWHVNDPPDAAEIERNSKVCENYQGNRNPFIDHPTLTDAIYGPPKPVPEAGREIYLECENIPTEPPTQSPGECQFLNPGDILFNLVNSMDPDTVEFVTLEDLPAGLELYLTDNAWDGSTFLSDEGIVKLEVPAQGISSGDNFGYGPGVKLGNKWTNFEGLFSLSTDGEQIFLFCFAAGGEFYPLAGLSYNGEFSPPGLASYQFNESAVPDSIADFSIVLNPHKDNWAFTNRVSGSKDDVRIAFLNTNNWEGNDGARFKSTNPPKTGSGAGRSLLSLLRFAELLTAMAVAPLICLLF